MRPTTQTPQAAALWRNAYWVVFLSYCCYEGPGALPLVSEPQQKVERTEMVKQTIQIFARLKPLGRRQPAGVGVQSR